MARMVHIWFNIPKNRRNFESLRVITSQLSPTTSTTPPSGPQRGWGGVGQPIVLHEVLGSYWTTKVEASIPEKKSCCHYWCHWHYIRDINESVRIPVFLVLLALRALSVLLV